MQTLELVSHVICAIDLGPTSEEALREADRVARTGHARLTVLHVIPDGYPGAPTAPGNAEQTVWKQQQLAGDVGGYVDDLVARTIGRHSTGDGATGDVTIEIETGVAHDLIIESAQEVGADLVVLSATGRGEDKVKPPLLGSVATHVARHAPTSVLVARARHAGGPVIVATDFSASAELALRVGQAEAAQRGAPLVVLHCLDAGIPEIALGDPGLAPTITLASEFYEAALPVARERLATLLQKVSGNAEVIIEREPPVTAIPKIALKRGADLVVVGAPHQGTIGRLLLGSVGDAVVRGASCSVLVARRRLAGDPASRGLHT